MSTPPLPVHFRGIVLGPSGFAAEGREWLAALEAAGFEPSLEGARLGDHDCPLTPAENALIGRCGQRPLRPGGITFHHLLIPHFAPDPRAEVDVLSTLFETAGLPKGWGARASQARLILVRTAWNRDSFASAGVPLGKMRVIPPPFDTTCFDPARVAPPTTDRPFRWLSVFDWTLRKGYDVLLRAFAEAFAPGEAELVLKVAPHGSLNTAQLRESCERTMQQHVNAPVSTVHVDDRILERPDLARVYRSADAFVLPSRGEGWGRPVHEAMLMELPVVVTKATALSTLVPDDSVGYPVNARPRPVDDDGVAETPWYRDQIWYEPDASHLVQRMREVFDFRDEANRRGRAARRHVLGLCDRPRIARALRSALEECLNYSGR